MDKKYKIFQTLAVISLLVNNVLFAFFWDVLLFQKVSAQEINSPLQVPTPLIEQNITPTIAAEPTVIQEPVISPAEIPLPDFTATPEPSLLPTGIKEIFTPTPEISLSPSLTPIIQSALTPTPIIEITPSPSIIPSVMPIETLTEISLPPTENMTITPTLEVRQTETPIPSLSPGPTQEPEAIECLPENSPVQNSTKEDWIIDLNSGEAFTKEKVRPGIVYQFPLEEKVSVFFKCLPKSEEKRSILKIRQIKISDLLLPEGLKPQGEFAYDISTEMANGNFEYEVTLPQDENKTAAQVVYIEKSKDEVLGRKIVSEDIENIDKGKISDKNSQIKIENMDHFTIFIVTGGTDKTSSITKILSVANEVALSASDELRYDTKGYWPSGHYDENQYLEFAFSPDVPSGSQINSVTLNFQYQRAGDNCQKGEARILYFLGSEEKIINLPWLEKGFKDSEIYSFNLNDIDSVEKLNNFAIKFQLYANDCSCVSTMHNLVELKVDYSKPNICSNDLDIGLLIDTSNSMNDDEKLSSAKLGAVNFVNHLDFNRDLVSLIDFNYDGIVRSQLTNDFYRVKSAITSLTVHGGTNLGEGILAAGQELNSSRHRAGVQKKLILLTDGYPTAPKAPFDKQDQEDIDAAINAAVFAKENNIQIFPIGLGLQSEINESLLQNIASMTGGKYYYTASHENLVQIYSSIAEYLCNQPTPTETPTEISITPTPTTECKITPTLTPTPLCHLSPTTTPISTLTPTPTEIIPTMTPTGTITVTPTPGNEIPTITPSPTGSEEVTPQPTQTLTPTPSIVPTNISLSKNNDHGGSNSPGVIVTYNLVITTTQIAPTKLILIDNLPEGFIYKPWSARIDKGTVENTEPSLSNNQKTLTWTFTSLPNNSEITVSYQATVDWANQAATYTNFAYAYDPVSPIRIESEIVSSEVRLDTGFSRGEITAGENSVKVLGAEIGGVILGATLPAAGSETWYAIAALSLIGSGFFLKKLINKL